MNGNLDNLNPDIYSYVLVEFHDEKSVFLEGKIIELIEDDFEVSFLGHSVKQKNSSIYPSVDVKKTDIKCLLSASSFLAGTKRQPAREVFTFLMRLYSALANKGDLGGWSFTSLAVARNVLKLDLKFHPYKIVCVQELKETDYPQRLDFATQMQVLLHDEPDVLIFMSDEAHVYLNGTVNQQNCRYWAQEKPRQLHEKPLHSPRVTVWCAVSREHVIGPFFFEEDGVAVTVNANRYVRMINDFFFLQLQMHNLQQDVWFQQDGATAHTARVSMTLLRNLFPGHVISRFADVPWPPRSPDLNICDFFCGYI